LLSPFIVIVAGMSPTRSYLIQSLLGGCEEPVGKLCGTNKRIFMFLLVCDLFFVILQSDRLGVKLQGGNHNEIQKENCSGRPSVFSPNLRNVVDPAVSPAIGARIGAAHFDKANSHTEDISN
jgi:hypothetical protein